MSRRSVKEVSEFSVHLSIERKRLSFVASALAELRRASLSCRERVSSLSLSPYQNFPRCANPFPIDQQGSPPPQGVELVLGGADLCCQAGRRVVRRCR